MLLGPLAHRGRTRTGQVHIDNSDNNVLESYGSLARINTIVRRGCRVHHLGGTDVSPVAEGLRAYD